VGARGVGAPRRGALSVAAAATALAASPAGCGDEAGFSAAAEPAASPPLTERPAGEVLTHLDGLVEGLAVDPRTGLVAAITREPVALTLISLDSGRITRRVPLPAVGRHLELAAPGGPVLVPAEGADVLVVVPLPVGHAREVAVGDFPHDVAVAGGRIFVGNEMGDTVTVMERGQAISTLESPVQPGGLATGDGFLAVVAVAERVLTVYDTRTLEPLGQVAAGTGPTHVVAAGRRAFVADTDGGAILEFRLGSDPAQVGSTPVGGAPYGIALDPRRRRLWVTLTARNQVVEYGIAGGGLEELARYPTVRQPNTIAVDRRSGDVLVAGKAGRGPLQRIEGA
jgi:DNA-binding beta-propeller fold protein YncE